ncbi:uncharacterized protein [Typha angustifolia]|uniref:uncharacterized protein n=1 Tax=Typha angustifolia TaxID=59011 RepID=UPI003C2FD10B
MVARMMRWRPWPPLLAKKFQVKLVVERMEGVRVEEPAARVTAEVRWKGAKAALSSLRRTVRRNRTREEEVGRGEEEGEGEGGVVEWNEEFESVLTLTSHRENVFHPWELSFVVFVNGLNQGSKSKASVMGTASLNLAEYASTVEEEVKINLPLLQPGVAIESSPSLHLSLSLVELRLPQESSETVQRSIVPVSSPSSGDNLPSEKDELSALKAGFRKVKILSEFVSTRKSKKTCRDDEVSEGKCSAPSDDAECAYPFDTDSLDDDPDEGELEDGKVTSSVRKSFSYGTLAYANYAGGSFYFDVRIDGEYDDWIYYSHRRSDVGYSHAEETTASVLEQPVSQPSKRSILPWKKRKLSFRSPKTKGEPLLKKAYGEEGGDDIDYDRRVLSSSDESHSTGRQKDEEGLANRLSISDFGDDNFVIGSWESKELVSRDGHMKISTQVFFASIDQRSERAAGESACTALVAVIADWFQTNRDMMPIKSQFDSLIREGSLEWRNLCKNQTYRERFPDKHFDLETVLHAKIRQLSVVPSKSFIGFFHPEGNDDNGGFDFLHEAMSFDSIWDEISRIGSECPTDGSPQLYIVSWNDHFFVLKVESDAYYIIDTLGERLYEGCNQAYILKFDDSTLIHRIPDEKTTANSDSTGAGNGAAEDNTEELGSGSGDAEGELVSKGKESCKEYIKSFLAAIPIRELQVDIKKGLMASIPLHHRLQIEFHYTESSQEVSVPAFPPAAGATSEFLWPVEPTTAVTLTPAVAV